MIKNIWRFRLYIYLATLLFCITSAAFHFWPRTEELVNNNPVNQAAKFLYRKTPVAKSTEVQMNSNENDQINPPTPPSVAEALKVNAKK